MKAWQELSTGTRRRLTAALLVVYFAVRIGVVVRSLSSASLPADILTFMPPSTEPRVIELVPTYELPPPYNDTEEPAHLTPVNPAGLMHKGSHPIDAVFRKGYLHIGHVFYVMDSDGKILFLKISDDSITCPGKWSLLGEHAKPGEDVNRTVVRTVEEKLGFRTLSVGEPPKFDNGAWTPWTVDFRPLSDARKTFHVMIQNLSEHPLYTVRHHGPSNDNRVERRLTYLWLVRFPMTNGEILWLLDDDYVSQKWLNMKEAVKWLSEDASKDSVEHEVNIEGTRDDGPDNGEFCHSTVRSLYQAGLARIR